ncbi:MAG: molybdate ABC transporter substrate-binding protein [Nitriliruptoraceae bacterium]
MVKRRRRRVLAAAAAALLAGCAPVTTDATTETITVFAAASLTDVVTDLSDAFGEVHPQVAVQHNFAGSQTLARQVVAGADADVVAFADTSSMAVVVDAGLVAEGPHPVATNTMAIAVAAGNPRDITAVADLADDRLLVVLPADSVPAGRYARTVLDRAGVDVAPVSLEPHVRAALTKVALGDADAALVYATDIAAAADRVEAVPIDAAVNVEAEYPMAALTSASRPDLAAEYVAFARSAVGREIFAAHGFGAP